MYIFGKISQKHENIAYKYISNNKEDFPDPACIQYTHYWAENNISTPQKAIALFRVLDRLKYSDNEIVQYSIFVVYKEGV